MPGGHSIRYPAITRSQHGLQPFALGACVIAVFRRGKALAAACSAEALLPAATALRLGHFGAAVADHLAACGIDRGGTAQAADVHQLAATR